MHSNPLTLRLTYSLTPKRYSDLCGAAGRQEPRQLTQRQIQMPAP